MEVSTVYRGVNEAAEVAASGGLLLKVKHALAVNYVEGRGASQSFLYAVLWTIK